MGEHFFYVSKKKNKSMYKFLVLLNIFCTIGIILLTHVFTYKDLLKERMSVIEEFLEIDSIAKITYINDLSSFHTLFENIVEVNKLETRQFRHRICS